ncbi:MAG: cytochrome C [Sphingobacteriales bacterium 17-39-43]|uniref:cytochrome c3 family protein n=1 Tax=Daejeonella sp. TaxID=2805397 RepID=UPI000BD36B99|nr:cytochrome c3 family protein [Daejeonella sp.]OYZ31053.1 MAG: cytochrome C [Sphingobacteriales bacterium 16-39-50]OZA23894.1 MAG: cytochrome C [Sphingobacteriales bacterium 17-39-43]OZA55216.1 MAG: cytochrome C [Sphingobacteriales bacterium 39-40-5]HQS51662.1 cytochrome c3 family protein [Daejeonella sp.]HQT23352.1 cytochrome c3 family protein [Daejeonella sp.]
MRSISLFFRSVTKSLFLVTLLCSMAVSSANAQDAAAGAAIFKQKCTACHGIDKAVVGPALKGIDTKYDEAWLIKWIKNAPAFIASGDAQAVKAAEYSPAMMSAFPELSDDDIKNIVAYVKVGDVKPAADPNAAAGAAGAPADKGGVSNFMLFGLLAVIIIAFLVILVLNRVITTLERVMLQKKGIAVEEEEGAESKDRFEGLKKLSKNKKFILFIVLLCVIFLGSAGWKGMWETGVHTGYQPIQPIKFSHQLHAGVNKIDCQYCHSGAFTSKNASIPSLNVCMNCHNYVTASEKYDGKTSPEIMKIYNALDYNEDTKVYGNNTKPVEWIRIHNLPDLAYFNHSQHVAVAGIECQKCHGPIQTMEEVYQYSPLTMKWCINCHRETEVNHKDNPYYDKLIAAHDKLKKGEKVTAAVLGGLECAKCHY